MLSSLPKYKIVLIGESGVGKTSYVSKLLGEGIPTRHLPTRGVAVNPLRVLNCIVNIWDCAGMEKYKGLEDGYLIGANAIVLMLDAKDPKRPKGADERSEENEYNKKWYKMLMRSLTMKKVPYIIVGNKDDEKNCVKLNVSNYYTISVKNDSVRDLLIPLNELVRKLN